MISAILLPHISGGILKDHYLRVVTDLFMPSFAKQIFISHLQCSEHGIMLCQRDKNKSDMHLIPKEHNTRFS